MRTCLAVSSSLNDFFKELLPEEDTVAVETVGVEDLRLEDPERRVVKELGLDEEEEEEGERDAEDTVLVSEASIHISVLPLEALITTIGTDPDRSELLAKDGS